MSRKKIKKDVVKRKTSIYDPMGVYGRGLTENQRLGMTNQMKIENIRNQEPLITKSLLEKYRNILIQYRIPTVYNTADNVSTIFLQYAMSSTELVISNNDIITSLRGHNIVPRAFFVDSFGIMKPWEDNWNTGVSYLVKVGNSKFYAPFNYNSSTTFEENDMIVVPAYWMNMESIHYFKVEYDYDRSGTRVYQTSFNMRGHIGYEDFLDLPNNGREMPYLLYPNTEFPELKFGLSSDSPVSGYRLRVKVVVMY